MNGVAKVFYMFTLITTVIGLGIGVVGFLAASGAPQEASAAAIGCLIVVAPYVFSRSIEKIGQ